MNKQNGQHAHLSAPPPPPNGKPPAGLAPPPKESTFNRGFRRVASGCATAVGSKWAFLLSITIVLVWALTGPLFHFSDTWQLVINTGTTIVTFLMVFLIQNTQNRDAKAIHLKLDELIRGVKGARTHLVNLEEFSDEELEHLRKQFESVRAEAEKKHQRAEATADAAHRKAEAAEDTSHDAHATARTAKDAALDAKRTAEDARAKADRVATERSARENEKV